MIKKYTKGNKDSCKWMFFGFRVMHLIMDSLQNHDMSFLYVYLCSVHTYPDIFEARDNFSPFSNKIWIIFTCPHENAKQWKYTTTLFRACIVLVVYDGWYYNITFENLHFCQSTCIREASIFKNLHSRDLYWEPVFWCPKTPFTCG